MLFPDYKTFSLKRELFPRHEEFNTNRLICGHLNRLKFPADIKHYLQWRKEGVGMGTAMARARRCFCKRENMSKDGVKEQMI